MRTSITRPATALFAASALVLTACGGGSDDAGTESPDSGTTADDPVDEEDGDDDAAGEEITLSFAHVLAESQPWHQCGALVFEEQVNASGTGLTVDLFPAAQTHNDTLEQLDAIDSGNLDITWATPAQLGTRLSSLDVFDAAYVFRDADHMGEAVQSEAAWELWDELRDEHGMRVIGTGYYGTRHLTSNNMVTSPEDMAGQRLRVLDAPLWLANGQALGAEPTPVAFSELYLALQQGVVDAQENPLPVIDAQGFAEVQDYVHLTGHVVAMMAAVISEDTWQSLSEDQQEAVLAAGEALGEGVTECTLEDEAELLEAWSGEDSEITVNDDLDLDAFRESALDVLFPEYEDAWGETYRSLQGEA